MITTDKPKFKVLVRDPNNDPMFVRWVADYPQRTVDSRQLFRAQLAAPLDPTLPSEVPDPQVVCDFRPELPYHRIQLYVADGDFVEPDDGQPFRYEQVAPGRFAVQATWIWNMQCPQGQP